MSLRNNFYRICLCLSIFFIVAVLIYAVRNPTSGPAKETVKPLEEDNYYLSGRTVTDFQPVILDNFRKESKLIVYSFDATEQADHSQSGFMGIGGKTQSLTYRGTASFSVDLSALDNRNITLDDEKQCITIAIPHAKLEPIEIDPDKFEASDTDNGFLSFGEMKFTAKEYNDLEKEVKQKIIASASTEENYTEADKSAIEQMKKIYDPIVKAVDPSYSVNIEFVGSRENAVS